MREGHQHDTGKVRLRLKGAQLPGSQGKNENALVSVQIKAHCQKRELVPGTKCHEHSPMGELFNILNPHGNNSDSSTYLLGLLRRCTQTTEEKCFITVPGSLQECKSVCEMNT